MSIRLSRPFVLVALAAAAMSAPALAVDDAKDPVLIQNSVTQIRRSDFDAELLRLPPDARPGFAQSEDRIRELLPRMLVTKTLAVQAKSLAIDKDPEIIAQIANATERFLGQVRLARVEIDAAKEFDAKRADYEARARELYVADKAAYATPEQIEASHILFTIAKHGKEKALELAQAARKEIAAGADFNKIATDRSEDPSATANNGHLGWFARDTMDPAFATAAFMLAKPGDVSEPVLSRFGWHLIKLEGRRPAGTRPFAEVRDQIMLKLKQQYVEGKRDDFLMQIRNDATTKENDANIEALVVHAPDPSLIQGMPLSAATMPATAAKPAPDAKPAK